MNFPTSQGGMYIFKGRQLLYARKDEGTGDHAPLDDILNICCAAPVAWWCFLILVRTHLDSFFCLTIDGKDRGNFSKNGSFPVFLDRAKLSPAWVHLTMHFIGGVRLDYAPNDPINVYILLFQEM